MSFPYIANLLWHRKVKEDQALELDRNAHSNRWPTRAIIEPSRGQIFLDN